MSFSPPGPSVNNHTTFFISPGDHRRLPLEWRHSQRRTTHLVSSTFPVEVLSVIFDQTVLLQVSVLGGYTKNSGRTRRAEDTAERSFGAYCCVRGWRPPQRAQEEVGRIHTVVFYTTHATRNTVLSKICYSVHSYICVCYINTASTCSV